MLLKEGNALFVHLCTSLQKKTGNDIIKISLKTDPQGITEQFPASYQQTTMQKRCTLNFNINETTITINAKNKPSFPDWSKHPT
jgi:hypothetical protein